MITDKGIDFVTRHEGFVSKAYKDPVGIVTIGTGFTNRSAVAVEMLGKIKLGMTITREQNDRVLREAFKREYGPPVDHAILGNRADNVFDAGYSYCFNCGPKAMLDGWVKVLNTESIVIAAAVLRTSRTTAKGRKLPGLVTRRKEEARLLELGDYGRGSTARSEQTAKGVKAPDDELREFQEMLNTLGYDCGTPDGWHGPKTTAAIITFQKNQPNLKDDGVLGPATKAAIQRALAARSSVSTGTIVTSGAGATAVVVKEIGGAKMDWLFNSTVVLALGLLVVLGFVAFKYRDEVKHWIKG